MLRTCRVCVSNFIEMHPIVVETFHSEQPHGGAQGKIRGFTKSWRCILRETWNCTKLWANINWSSKLLQSSPRRTYKTLLVVIRIHHVVVIIVCIEHCANPCRRCENISPKLISFILWAPWISVQNLKTKFDPPSSWDICIWNKVVVQLPKGLTLPSLESQH